MPLNLTAAERIDRRTVSSGDCILWTGCTTPNGYGSITYDTKRYGAHVFIWRHSGRTIPNGLQLDHLCRNRRCVNPEHLELVTAQENVLRGVGITAQNARKTHCKSGHEFTEDNTYHRPDSPHQRACKVCRLLQKIRYKARLK